MTTSSAASDVDFVKMIQFQCMHNPRAQPNGKGKFARRLGSYKETVKQSKLPEQGAEIVLSIPKLCQWFKWPDVSNFVV